MSERACQNSDRELWRERFGDFYSDSIHVTERGGIGIDCGGHVIVKPLREWHRLASAPQASQPPQGAADRDLLLRCLGMIPLGAWVRAGTCYNECKAAIDRLAASTPPATQEPACYVRVKNGMLGGARRGEGMKSLPDGDHALYAAPAPEGRGE